LRSQHQLPPLHPQQLPLQLAQLHSITQYLRCTHHPVMPPLPLCHFSLLCIRLKRAGHLLLQTGSQDLLRLPTGNSVPTGNGGSPPSSIGEYFSFCAEETYWF
jgi:hypothetical protein